MGVFFVEKWVAGSGPAATHLSCFAKKSKQKKATTAPLPLRGACLCKTKMGSGRNSLPLQGAYPLASGYRYAGADSVPRIPCYTSNNVHFFFHFLSRTNGIFTVDNIHRL
ncbi:hypothetical protein DBR37_11975 [Herminiimonas sp. KBW02]|nr:hypothetical protein DBR37_11975 [Herminiimonas sp. KBW02]